MSAHHQVAELARSCADVLRRATEIHQRSERLITYARRSVTAREQQRLDDPAAFAVSVQAASSNSKLAPQRVELATSGRKRYVPIGPYCASTYVSIAASCPGSCPFRDNGCYAQAGQSHLTMAALDRAGRQTSALAVTLAEAAKLDALWPNGVPLDGHRGNGRDLRLHVGGDVSCERGAQALAAAVRRLRARGLGAAWTYTHRWREIPRSAFGPIATLASVETPEQAEQALQAGYAAALTVDRFPSRRRFPIGPKLSAIPCPFEGGHGKTCVQCRLCFDDQRLRRGRMAIAFAAHGAAADLAVARLRVLNPHATTP